MIDTQDKDKDTTPKVRARRRVSKVWLVPIVAAIAATWMLVSPYIGRGPKVTVSFARAEGLVAGETVVKFKNIKVGVVEEISLSEDFAQVIATIRLEASMKDHLGENSQFWVVKPRIALAGVSGLDTLLSGSYLEFEPGPGTQTDEFIGLEQPPTTPADAPGRHLLLKAPSLGSVGVGSEILYRDISVGQVDGYKLKGDHVELGVYIEEPFVSLVRSNSKFWQTSGLEVSMDTAGFRFKTASMNSLLRGGLAFETPAGVDAGDSVANGASFQLYSHHDEIGAEYIGTSFEVIMYFENSIRGLEVGAPVEFRGIKVGRVSDVQLQYDVRKTWIQIPVKAVFEAERFHIVQGQPTPLLDTLAEMVKRGLRARVLSGSLLTGAMFVDLDFDGDAPLELRGNANDPFEIPTMPSGTDELIENAGKLLAKLEKLPLASLLKEAQKTLTSARNLVDGLESETETLLSRLTKTADAANAAIVRLESQIGSAIPDGAQFDANLSRVLKELSAAAASVKKLADTLAREPESLLRGRR